MTSTHSIPEDVPLLKVMLDDAQLQSPIYKPSKYWRAKSMNAVKEIEKHGLNGFRSDSNSVGTSFADNMYYDTRTLLGFGFRKPFRFLFEKVFPFKNIFNAQVALTKGYARDAIRMRGYINATNPHWSGLLSKYKMPYSVAGYCVDYFHYNGQKISNHYVTLLDTHDCVSKLVDFSKVRSFFEIGGGFGLNVHLLVENYPNLKKFIYLDIPPNLYVGTQYLKSFYGDKVKDYNATRNLNEIRFSDNDELEIICIASWQIEKLKTSIDVFYNANSFVEMTPEIVKNYAKFIEKLPGAEKTIVVMVTYDCGDPATTIPPQQMMTFFNKKFEKTQQTLLPKETCTNLVFVGK